MKILALLKTQYQDQIISALPAGRANLYEKLAEDIRRLPARSQADSNALLSACKQASAAAATWRKWAGRAGRTASTMPAEPPAPSLSNIFRDGDDWGITVGNLLTVWFLRGDSKQTCLESNSPIPNYVERQWQDIATAKFLAALRTADPANGAPNASAFIDALKTGATAQ